MTPKISAIVIWIDLKLIELNWIELNWIEFMRIFQMYLKVFFVFFFAYFD